jgi:hypothetical protein
MVVKAGASKIDDAPGDAANALREPLDGCTRSLNRRGREVRGITLFETTPRAWGGIAEDMLFRVGPPVVMVMAVILCGESHLIVGVHVARA